ncbi:serine protease [Pseudoxanthomonas gei]|uniref:Serine protease n=1 Tax=Pseudoxanthomonas gei TaxID=1383030 RepID=A0ABX0A8R0_9GAMM|nr:PA domain-containing protein [Pseudoxanthomonas gei]NDK37902.1 serine protease [Pseudoxanthomonas gei]
MKKTLLISALSAALFAGNAVAANIIPINADPAGQGLNDPTALAPAGGNPGVTIGEQRRIAYQYAADLWGAVLVSPVNIRVQASFQALQCDAAGTVLGSAGTSPIYVLTETGKPDTLYHGALADSLVGQDLQNGAGVDIISRFNSSYGLTNPNGTACSPGSGWYYGLDGNTPAGKTNFLNVVMHEIAHGLGFSGFGSVTTGAPLAGYQDIYSRFAWNNVTNQGWYQMTNAGRVAAVIGGNLAFRGPIVTSQVPLVLDEKIALRASGTVSGDYSYGTAAFGPGATAANFTGSVVLVNDGSATPSQGCAASPAGAYTGKIAIVDRGTCAFEIKARFAQNAGATAVIVANNVNALISMADDASVTATVPTLSVSSVDGAAIKAGLPGVNVTLAAIPGRLAGADASGYALLYSPNPVASGSSFSHYDTSTTPNALMEPAITQTLAANYNVDLTPALFQDEGWTLTEGNAKIAGCDTGIPVAEVGGLIIGANVIAQNNLCQISSANQTAYTTCMTNFRTKLRAGGLINTTQAGKLQACVARNR